MIAQSSILVLTLMMGPFQVQSGSLSNRMVSPETYRQESNVEHLNYWIRTLEAHPLELIRENAARVLGSMGDPQAVPSLVKGLRDEFHGVRLESAKSLGLLGDEAAIPYLEEAKKRDSDALVRRAAESSIEKIQAYHEYLKKREEKQKAENEKVDAKKSDTKR